MDFFSKVRQLMNLSRFKYVQKKGPFKNAPSRIPLPPWFKTDAFLKNKLELSGQLFVPAPVMPKTEHSSLQILTHWIREKFKAWHQGTEQPKVSSIKLYTKEPSNYPEQEIQGFLDHYLNDGEKTDEKNQKNMK